MILALEINRDNHWQLVVSCDYRGTQNSEVWTRRYSVALAWVTLSLEWYEDVIPRRETLDDSWLRQNWWWQPFKGGFERLGAPEPTQEHAREDSEEKQP